MTDQELINALNNWLNANNGTLNDGVSNAITGAQDKNDAFAATLQEFVNQTSERATTSQEQYQATMNRLLDREERYGTGNPFIDAMEAYTSYKKRKNPDYKFNGLMGAIDDWRDKRKESQPSQGGDAASGGQNMFQRVGNWWRNLTDGRNDAPQPDVIPQIPVVNQDPAPTGLQAPAQDFDFSGLPPSLLSLMNSPQRHAAWESGLGTMTQLHDLLGSREKRPNIPEYNKSAGWRPSQRMLDAVAKDRTGSDNVYLRNFGNYLKSGDDDFDAWTRANLPKQQWPVMDRVMKRIDNNPLR